MIPIGDYAGARPRFPIVNIALILINIAVFIYELSLGGGARLQEFFFTWGAIPREVTRGTDLAPTIQLPIYVTLLTSIFMHGGWLHLGGNMLYLWVFGDNVEDGMGHLKYLLFYLICGVAAGLAQIAINPNSTIPLVGASGAIAGVMGAYLVMFPGATIRTVVILVFFITVTYLPAILVIGVWFLIQLYSGVGSLGVRTAQGGVAFWAHVGGFVAGMLLSFLFRRRGYRASAPRMYQGYGN